MGLRIMQLEYKRGSNEVDVQQGILLKKPYLQRYDSFGEIESIFKPCLYDLKIFKIHEYEVQELGDGYRKIKLNPPTVVDVEKEEAILVIVEYSEKIFTTKRVKKIAGRYPNEGIFILKPNDKISVKKGSVTEEFAALKFENKMYLVKVHTD